LSKFVFVIIGASSKRVVCYYTNWSQYRPDGGKFFPEDIDPSLCTNIIFAFAKLTGNKLEAFEWNDEDTDWSQGAFFKLAIMHISGIINLLKIKACTLE